ncbi:hypothetical protein CR513_32464, partial [Mucuna pruriens]
MVPELFGLKGVVLARIMKGNTNRMVNLNDTNYHLWKGKMKDLLFVKKMHLPVFAAQKPKSMSDEEWDFEHQQFKEDTSVSDHLNEFQGIIDQMSRMGIKFEDEILGLLLLNSLPEFWETFKGSVLNEEMRRKAQGSSSQSKVVVTENSGRSQKKERENSRKNKGKKGKSKEKDDDDDPVTTAIGDDCVTTASGLISLYLVTFSSSERLFPIKTPR